MEAMSLAAKHQVEGAWKGAERRIGQTFFEALMARRVLYLLSIQSEDVSAERIRELVIKAHEDIIKIAEDAYA